jgi:hypothetical protein
MATITYVPADAALAERLQADLSSTQAGESNAIFVLSPAALADADIQAALVRAVENHQHIIPVLAQPTPLPRLIEHLEPVDFSQRYDFGRLSARLPAAPGELQMKVLTPEVQAVNRRIGAIFVVIAVIIFVIALYAVGVLGLQAPAEEYADVETQVFETRSAIIEQALPRSTEDAANFPATLDAAAPSAQPALAATATARAGETP